MEPNDEVLGYMKYSGKMVESGFLDARKSASALLGLDAALRYFIRHDFPALEKTHYEIPVKIRKGSWEAIISENIGSWIMAGTGIAATAYASAAAAEIGKNDFKDASIKKVFINAFKSIQWFIKISKHIGHSKQRKFENVKFRNENKEIGIPNEDNEYLFVPKEILEQFSTSNPKLLEELVRNIEEERYLVLGVVENGKHQIETITKNEKHIFCEEDEDEILFPELIHGQYVEIEGDITRGNENANNLGLRYDGYMLTIIPENGSIVKYKNALFLKCLVCGVISRRDKFGNITEKKPKIFFSKVVPLESDNEDLFKEKT